MPSSPTVIVLAAGQGSRFLASGGTTHKLDALLDGLAVLEHVLRAARASGLPWHLVRPAGGTPGMGDSIARGVAATASASGWLILPADLPLVRPETLRSVAQALAGHPVVVPRWRGQAGHPVGFGRQCLAALAALSGERGAAAVVRAHREAGTAHDLALSDPGILMDIDTVQDLARAQALLQAQQ
ncbi:nucleotidyltransferase family protein [Orrella sp. JC864]|uniref:nucleotidyltransferase family protein n=1 Tax=Orrella sp. JC864 TaxID=3120298 RepID=UPI0012BB70E2